MNPKITNAININQYRKSNAVYLSRRSKVHIAPTSIITMEIPSLFKSVRKISPHFGQSRFFLKFQNVTSKPSNSFPQPGQFLSSDFFINHNAPHQRLRRAPTHRSPAACERYKLLPLTRYSEVCSHCSEITCCLV